MTLLTIYGAKRDVCWKRGLFLFLACVEVSRCHHDNSRAASTTALCYSHGE